ncbi:MAG TPA: maltose alpha-D-glucosyltransferase [Anaerolineales bacterium]|jgi:maltose alpha-D-glucosyltransferase/alpha-amylase
MSTTLWYKDAIFYELPVRAFYDSNGDGIGDLPGVTARLDYLQSLGVTAVWFLPITPSPMRDDGYDVSDYCSIDPMYGTHADFQTVVSAAHLRGLKIVVELIPNHTSDQHAWFQASHDPQHPQHAKYRDYYVWSETGDRYREARIIFTDSEKSNWTYDPLRKAFFWHRFFHHQPDLNYDNPEVQKAMLRSVQFWLEQGVDGIRVDAPPYLFERDGTTCENLPETHQFLKRLRAFVDAYAPGTLLLSEANQWPEDVRPYFGDGDEMHMNFHFPLMPRIFMALRQHRRDSLEWILERTPPLPDSCQWGIFLRCHDELTLEMVSPEERQWMWDQYAPQPRMRLNMGIRRRLAPLLDNDRRKIELANSMLFTFPGSPFLYYGDEIGMGDNIWLPDRNGVRTPMQWTDAQNAGYSNAPLERLYTPVIEDPTYGPAQVNVQAQVSDPNSLFHTIQHMIATRKSNQVFGRGDFAWVDVGTPAIAAYLRCDGSTTLLVLNNLSDETQVANPPAGLSSKFRSALTGSPFDFSGPVSMQPFQYFWLFLQD